LLFTFNFIFTFKVMVFKPPWTSGPKKLLIFGSSFSLTLLTFSYSIFFFLLTKNFNLFLPGSLGKWHLFYKDKAKFWIKKNFVKKIQTFLLCFDFYFSFGFQIYQNFSMPSGLIDFLVILLAMITQWCFQLLLVLPPTLG